jgi:hypothetical protein
MRAFLAWISRNPSAFASLVASVIAASVALVVFALTQLLAARRERKQFLTPKLEQLYLLLSKVADHNVRCFKLVYAVLHAPKDARGPIFPTDQKLYGSIDEEDLYGHRTAKELIMYVRLYFPNLSQIHQLLFGAQSALNDTIFRIQSGSPPDYSYVERAFGKVAHLTRLMEAEMIRNRDRLLGDYFFFKRYVPTARDEIQAENPAPPGPAMIFPGASAERPT